MKIQSSLSRFEIFQILTSTSTRYKQKNFPKLPERLEQGLLPRYRYSFRFYSYFYFFYIWALFKIYFYSLLTLQGRWITCFKSKNITKAHLLSVQLIKASLQTRTWLRNRITARPTFDLKRTFVICNGNWWVDDFH